MHSMENLEIKDVTIQSEENLEVDTKKGKKKKKKKANPVVNPGNSLNDVVQHFLNKTLHKGLRLNDWRVRPLSEEMLNYATQDAACLVDVYISFLQKNKDLN